jgi:hypothetical protein
MSFTRTRDTEQWTSRCAAVLLGMVASFLFVACGGRHAEAEKPAAPAIVAPPPEYEMRKMPESASAAPMASDSAAPAPLPPPAKKSKAMQPVFSNDKGVSTIVGTVGAVFKVAGATLHIPEDALRDGKDVRFAPSRTVPTKGEPARLGTAFDIGPALASAGPPFELVLPLPPDAGDVVLVTVVRSKTKDGKPKTDVSTLAPKSTDPSKHEALFELAELPEGDAFLAAKPASTSSPEASAAPSAAPPAASVTARPQR